jgi:outer membrane protein assembly factor BamD (BamD/ComL family)
MRSCTALPLPYQAEEEPDEAAKYYQQLVQGYPDSEYQDKAREQLGIIGAPVPRKELQTRVQSASSRVLSATSCNRFREELM